MSTFFYLYDEENVNDISFNVISSWDKLQLTAWVPLVPAVAENGCMQVISGGHKAGITVEHTCCVGGTWYTELEESDIEPTLGIDPKAELVTCEVPKGSGRFKILYTF